MSAQPTKFDSIKMKILTVSESVTDSKPFSKRCYRFVLCWLTNWLVLQCSFIIIRQLFVRCVIRDKCDWTLVQCVFVFWVNSLTGKFSFVLLWRGQMSYQFCVTPDICPIGIPMDVHPWMAPLFLDGQRWGGRGGREISWGQGGRS